MKKIKTKVDILFGLLTLITVLVFLFLFASEIIKNPVSFISSGNGDFLTAAAQVKLITENYNINDSNPRLGAPFGHERFDFPISESTNLFIIKVISLFWSDWEIVMFIYYITGFFSIALFTYYVLLLMGGRPEWSYFGGVVFTFLPYHFYRTGHFWLVSYYSVPLTIFLCLLIPKMLESHGSKKILYILILIIGSLILAGSGIYYAFFGFFAIAISILFFWLKHKNRKILIFGFTILLSILTGVGLNLYPSLKYNNDNGKNLSTIEGRNFVQSEIFALKLIQLILPHQEHRIELFKGLEHKYSSVSPNVNENRTASIGIFGLLGLIIIAFTFLKYFAAKDNGSNFWLLWLCVLTIFTLLVATPGSLNSLFSMIISPLIRAWNRISVFVGFFAIGAFVLEATRFFEYLKLNYKQKYIIFFNYSLVVVLMLLAGFDQIPRLHHDPNNNPYLNNKEIFSEVEKKFNPGDALFQLPYHPFPEGGYSDKWPDYSHLRGYLFTDSIYWSYGAMKFRKGDLWFRLTSFMPIHELVPIISTKGYNGIYVDVDGYKTQEEALFVLNELNKLLGKAVYVSPDDKIHVFKTNTKSNLESNFEGLFSNSIIKEKPIIRGFGNIDLFNPYRQDKENGVIEINEENSTIHPEGDLINFSGWVGDPTSLEAPKKFKVYLVSDTIIYKMHGYFGIERTDVELARNASPLRHSGFLVLLNLSGVKPGTYDIFLGYEDEKGEASFFSGKKIVISDE